MNDKIKTWIIEYTDGTLKPYVGTYEQAVKFFYLEGDHAIDLREASYMGVIQ